MASDPTTSEMDVSVQYTAIRDCFALFQRADRALLEVKGRDRATWLHNLTTNQVKPLQPGEGNYAFCLNVQGRILFDLNILVRSDSILLDIDRGFLTTSRAHFDKYTITENVQVADRTDAFARFTLMGGVKTLLAELGSPHVAALPLLGSAEMTFAGAPVLLARTDFCGPFAIEFFVPLGNAGGFRQQLMQRGTVVQAGSDAVEMHRIEAGIPWPGHEIADEYLPAETGQLARAVSFQKGCYLGQEVVERMRSRGVVARLLRGLVMQGGAVPPQGTAIVESSGKVVGSVTSSCLSPALNKPIAMAYLKTAHAVPSQQVSLAWEGGCAAATVIELPFTRGMAE